MIKQNCCYCTIRAVSTSSLLTGITAHAVCHLHECNQEWGPCTVQAREDSRNHVSGIGETPKRTSPSPLTAIESSELSANPKRGGACFVALRTCKIICLPRYSLVPYYQASGVSSKSCNCKQGSLLNVRTCSWQADAQVPQETTIVRKWRLPHGRSTQARLNDGTQKGSGCNTH
eukprot:4933305-Amphidinium_carterae.2